MLKSAQLGQQLTTRDGVGGCWVCFQLPGPSNFQKIASFAVYARSSSLTADGVDKDETILERLQIA